MRRGGWEGSVTRASRAWQQKQQSEEQPVRYRYPSSIGCWLLAVMARPPASECVV